MSDKVVVELLVHPYERSVEGKTGNMVVAIVHKLGNNKQGEVLRTQQKQREITLKCT